MALIEMERPSRPSGKPSALRDWVRALEATASITAQPRRLLYDVISEVARTRGEAAALVSAGECLSYRVLVGRANRYARWALARGLAKGDTVALMMPNRPEYVAVWLGLTAVGVVVALINTNLRGAALAHSIEIAAPKELIAAAEFADECRAAAAPLVAPPAIWSHGAGPAELPRIDEDIERHSAAALESEERRPVTIADRALLIYTSGTTGLPKAANVSHHRLLQWSFWFAGLVNTGPDDRMYDCLPMYHSTGGVVAIGALLVRGGSVVIRDRFSSRKFWSDICDWDCTLFQYIGELCRYLVNAPSDPRERQHRLRMACGNGLREEVWRPFQARFGIPRILEFYAATEGNVSLYNVEGKVGAVGRLPSFLAHRFPLALVQFDHATGEPARDAAGLCRRSAPGEVGEAIARICDGSAQGAGAFEGYTDREASERKILRDVFARGDAWYRTGDLMWMDPDGFYYFADRVGDTFRWKGENVAASEVAAAIGAFAGVSEATVYGVAVPGCEGAAGMATIVVAGPLDLSGLHAHLERRLPAYARPLFVRIGSRIDVTATFKHRKNDLAREGYDPTATTDAIYFDDPQQQSYVRLDGALYARIRSGAVRL